MPDEISREVDKFIRDHISSVEQLEVLLLLAQPPQQEWSAAQVAQKLYRQPESVGAHLKALEEAKLLTVGEGGGPTYRYGTTSVTTDSTVRALDKAYRERKDTVIRLIFSRPPDAIRSFADAFRFRPKE
ncbi:MAG: hypothetical protein EOO38_09255 [Cytophagaceae bacterium]|nr:MAG: hypothetical protein EOO38_09255 [Cytophagaceae bacterium]